MTEEKKITKRGSELEEIIDEEIEEDEVENKIDEEISEENFDEDVSGFVSTRSDPSLKKINISAEQITNLEEDLRETTQSPKKKIEEGDSFNYANIKSEEEKVYQDFEPDYSAEIVKPLSKLENDNFRRQVDFVQSSEVGVSSEKQFERYENVRNFNEQDFKKDESSMREIKYKPSR